MGRRRKLFMPGKMSHLRLGCTVARNMALRWSYDEFKFSSISCASRRALNKWCHIRMQCVCVCPRCPPAFLYDAIRSNNRIPKWFLHVCGT